MLVDGKRLLITGVLTPGSIAYAVAREALDNGAEVVLTGFGRTRSLTQRTARAVPRFFDVAMSVRQALGDERDHVASVVEVADHRELRRLPGDEPAPRVKVGEALGAAWRWLLDRFRVRW